LFCTLPGTMNRQAQLHWYTSTRSGSFRRQAAKTGPRWHRSQPWTATKSISRSTSPIRDTHSRMLHCCRIPRWARWVHWIPAQVWPSPSAVSTRIPSVCPESTKTLLHPLGTTPPVRVRSNVLRHSTCLLKYSPRIQASRSIKESTCWHWVPRIAVWTPRNNWVECLKRGQGGGLSRAELQWISRPCPYTSSRCLSTGQRI